MVVVVAAAVVAVGVRGLTTDSIDMAAGCAYGTMFPGLFRRSVRDADDGGPWLDDRCWR